jgi:hypothetical protein
MLRAVRSERTTRTGGPLVRVLLGTDGMRVELMISLLLCLMMATACNENSPTGPTVPLDREFTLAPGETAAIDDTDVRVRFLRVSGDSRCPADAVCIQGGDALVHIRAANGDTREYELHTADESRAAVTHHGVRIALVNLQPFPFSSRTIQPEEYRATFRVTR